MNWIVALAGTIGCASIAAVVYGARLFGVDLIHDRGNWGPEWQE